jgi:hypothetical protein
LVRRFYLWGKKVVFLELPGRRYSWILVIIIAKVVAGSSRQKSEIKNGLFRVLIRGRGVGIPPFLTPKP